MKEIYNKLNFKWLNYKWKSEADRQKPFLTCWLRFLGCCPVFVSISSRAIARIETKISRLPCSGQALYNPVISWMSVSNCSSAGSNMESNDTPSAFINVCNISRDGFTSLFSIFAIWRAETPDTSDNRSWVKSRSFRAFLKRLPSTDKISSGIIILIGGELFGYYCSGELLKKRQICGMYLCAYLFIVGVLEAAMFFCAVFLFYT